MKKIYTLFFLIGLVIVTSFIYENNVLALESGFNLNYEVEKTQVNLSWEGDSNAEKYGLFASEEDGSFMPISYGIDFTTEPKGEILNLKPNTKYKISVYAYMKNSEYIHSETVEITTGDAIRFESVSQGVRMTFFWDKDEEAEMYNIYKVNSYSDGNPRDFKLMATIDNTTTDSQVKYTAQQATINGFVGNFVLEIVKENGKTVKSRFLEAKVENFWKTNGRLSDDGDLYLEWESQENANKYYIYGRDDSTSTTTFYGATTDTSFHFGKLEEDKDYTLFIIADLENGDISEAEETTFNFKKKIDIKESSSTIADKIYNGKAQKPSFVVKKGSYTLKSGIDYKIIDYKDNINVGTATIIIQGCGNYTGTKNITFKIIKANNPMNVTAKNKKIKYKKVKNKKQVITPITVSKAQGTLSYTKVSDSKRIKVNKKTGKITVKKKTKKGTYKINIKVNAAGNNNYKSIDKNVTIKIKVK